MKEVLIDLFGMAPKAHGEAMDFATLNKKAVRLGYLIHPDCCTPTLEDWLDDKIEDYNATFYKEWSDVLSRNRFELFVDQLLHYASTYGTDFQGCAWKPNSGSVQPDFTHLKVIKPGTDKEFFDAAMRLLKSGVALNSSAIYAVCDFVVEMVKNEKFDIDLAEVKCREAQAHLAMRLERLPHDEFGILRCLLYAFAGSCMLIKDEDTINAIKRNARSDSDGVKLLCALSQANLVALSRIFRRYKPLFLAMKCKQTARIINKINKLSVKHHTPLKIGFWESALATPHTDEEISKALGSLDNFRKVRILQAINVAFLDEEAKVYVIRNGQLYVRHGYAPHYDVAYLERLRKCVRQSLVTSLAKKACRVKYPVDFDLAVPSSQKTFVGNLPFGTSFKMTENNVIGIYWRNEWGTNDFDLSMTDFSGRTVSWCNDYWNADDSVIHSGDMTDADPEATELLFVKGSCPDGVIRVNRYWGDKQSQFRFFTANEERPAKGELCNYMVNPNNVKMDTLVKVDQRGQKTVGVVHENTLTLMDLVSGSGRVARSDRSTREFINVMANRTKAFLRLKDILTEAGFTEDENNPEIDFTNLTANTIIDLLAGGELETAK